MNIIEGERERFDKCIARSDALWIRFTNMVSNYLNWELDTTYLPSNRLNTDGDIFNAGFEQFSSEELFELRKEIFAEILNEYKDFIEKIHKRYIKFTKKYSVNEIIFDRSKYFSGLSDEEIKSKIDQCFLYFEQKFADELNN